MRAQEWAWIGTALAAFVALIRLITELDASRKQRARDLRWKQALAAKELIEEMLNDDGVNRAFSLLDYPSASIDIDDSDTCDVVSRDDVRIALDPRVPANDPLVRTVRDAFDSLFYYMASIEHYTATSLVVPEDLAFPLDYYYWHFDRLSEAIDGYVSWYGLSRAKAFLERQRRRMLGVARPPAFGTQGGPNLVNRTTNEGPTGGPTRL